MIVIRISTACIYNAIVLPIELNSRTDSYLLDLSNRITDSIWFWYKSYSISLDSWQTQYFIGAILSKNRVNVKANVSDLSHFPKRVSFVLIWGHINQIILIHQMRCHFLIPIPIIPVRLSPISFVFIYILLIQLQVVFHNKPN
jgi:hypothetical protein